MYIVYTRDCGERNGKNDRCVSFIIYINIISTLYNNIIIKIICKCKFLNVRRHCRRCLYILYFSLPFALYVGIYI